MTREGISTRLRSWVLVEKAGGEEPVDWLVLVVQSAGGVGAELLVGVGEGRVLVEKAGEEEAVDWMVLVVQSAGGVGGGGGEGEEAVTTLHP